MALTTTRIAGRITAPNGENMINTRLEFVLTGYDTDNANDVTVVQIPVYADVDDSGDIEIDLFPSSDSTRSRFYRVSAVVSLADKVARYPIGAMEVPDIGGPYDINDILTVEAPAGVTVDEYLAQLQAAVALSTNSATAAAASATEAAESANAASPAAFLVLSYGTNTTPGVTDMTAAVAAAVAAAESGMERGDTFNIANQGATVDLQGQLCAISDKITLTRPIRFVNGSLSALAAFSSDYMLQLNAEAEGADVDNICLDGGQTDNGDGTFTRHADLILNNAYRTRISSVLGVNFPNYGLRVTRGQEVVVSNCNFREWQFVDDGTSDATLRTAKGVSIEDADGQYTNVTAAQCAIPIHVSAPLNIFTGCHPYNGGDTGAGNNPVVVIDNTNGQANNNIWNGCYFDNGTVTIISDGSGVKQTFSGCHWQQTAAGSSTTGINIVTSDTGDNVAGLSVVGCKFNGSFAGGKIAFEGAGTFATDQYKRLTWVGNLGSDGLSVGWSVNIPGLGYGEAGILNVEPVGDAFTMRSPKGLILEADYDDNTGAGPGREVAIKAGGVAVLVVDKTTVEIALPVTGSAVVQSSVDTTSGRIPTVGWMGIGSTNTPSISDLTAQDRPVGFFQWAPTAVGKPDDASGGYGFTARRFGGLSEQSCDILFDDNAQRMWIQFRYGGNIQPAREVWHSGNTTVDANGFIKSI